VTGDEKPETLSSLLVYTVMATVVRTELGRGEEHVKNLGDSNVESLNESGVFQQRSR
jgi:hypothetical protein